jgi:hypothetical protein
MRRTSTLLVFFFLILPAPGRAQDRDDVVGFFPGRRIFPVFTADALTHQISLSRITKDRDWIGTIGGSIPVAQVNLPGAELQVGAAASTFNRLIKPPGLTVYTVDYKVDFPFDVRLGPDAFRFAVGHYSCHFVDDGIEIIGKQSIQYIKDYVTFAGARDLPFLGGYAYVAATWTYHNVPVRDKQWQLQLGGEGGNLRLNPFVQLYGAVDIKLKEEVAWGSTQSYQIGARFFVNGLRDLRLAYTVRRGFDERGQFFDQRENVSMISVFLDF